MSTKLHRSNKIRQDSNEMIPDSVIISSNCSKKEKPKDFFKAYSRSELFWATKRGDVAAFERHMKSTSNFDRELNRLDGSSMSPLHYAAKYDRSDIVKLLIENEADVNNCGPTGVPPVFMAVKYNATSALQTLIHFNCSLDVLDLNGRTLLHEAAKYGFVDICQILLKHNRNFINMQDQDLLTPLHVACQRGKTAICLLLLENKADITMSTTYGSFPLHYAAASGNIEIIQSLLDQAHKLGRTIRNEVQMRDCEGQTPLHLATQNRYVKAVEELLRNKANVEDIEKNGLSSLHMASSNGCSEIVSMLLSKGAKVDANDSQRRTPLHYAAMSGHWNICEILLKQGANLHIGDRKRRTAFLFAVEKGQIETVNYLLSQGCDIGKTDDLNQNSLHVAVIENRFHLLKLLLQHADRSIVNGRDVFERTPLHYAAESGNGKVIKLLLNAQAVVQCFDSDNNSPLHLACKNGQYSIIELLLRNDKALINSPGERSQTPLHFAVLSSSSQAVEALLSYNITTDKINASCATPMEIACEKGYLDIIKLLLKSNAQLDLVTYRGSYYLHIAALHGHADVVKVLLELGADCTTVDKNDETCLDIAIDRGWENVAMVIVTHPSGRSVLNRVDKGGHSTLQNLVRKLPSVAKIVMNQCVKTTSNGINNEVKIEYDFSLIDPGPEFENKHRINGYAMNLNALQTMANYNHDDLLLHQLSQRLLLTKWNRFGWIAYYFTFIIYVVFVTSLTGFAIFQGNYYAAQHFNRAPIIGLDIPGRAAVQPLPIAHPANKSKTECIHDDALDGSPVEETFITLNLIFAIINLIKEGYQIIYHKWRYFKHVENYMELALYATIIIARFPIACIDSRLTLLSFMVFLAYINLLVQIQRMDIIGIYVIMLRSMVETIVKVLVVVFILALGFAISFHLLDPQSISLDNIPLALVRMMVMTIGEFDYRDSFLTDIADGDIRYPRSIMVLVIFVFFIIIMPVMVMNLMVGLAVGDIEQVRRDATLKKIILQVNSLVSLERAMPMFLRNYYYTDYKVSFYNSLAKKLQALANQQAMNPISKDANNNESLQRIGKLEQQLDDHKRRLEDIAGQLNSICTILQKSKN